MTPFGIVNTQRRKARSLTFILWTLGILYLFIPQKGTGAILSVDKAIDLFLLNSFDVQIENIRQQKAQHDTDAFLGIYDFIMNGQVAYLDSPSISVASSNGASFFKSLNGYFNEATLSKKFPFGMEFALKLSPNYSKIDLVPRGVGPASIEGFEHTLALTAKASLLKNFFGQIDFAQLGQLKGNEIIAKLSTLIAIENIFRQGIDLYRLWYTLKRSVVLRQKNLNRARALLRLDRQKLKDGLIEEGEFAQSKVGVESRKIELERSKDRLNQANHTFASFLNITIKEVEAFDAPNLSKSVKDYPQLSDKALVKQNLTINFTKAQHKVSELSVLEKKYDRMADLNLFGEIGFAGANKKLGRSVDDLLFDHPNYLVGFEFVIPFQNTTKIANYRKSLLVRQEVSLEIKKTEKTSIESYHSALSTLKSLAKRIKNMKTLLRLQKVKVREESKKYDQGRSSIDLVLRFQDELTDFELQRIQFLGEYIKKWIELQLIDTQLMKSHGVPLPNINKITL